MSGFLTTSSTHKCLAFPLPPGPRRGVTGGPARLGRRALAVEERAGASTKIGCVYCTIFGSTTLYSRPVLYYLQCCRPVALSPCLCRNQCGGPGAAACFTVRGGREERVSRSRTELLSLGVVFCCTARMHSTCCNICFGAALWLYFYVPRAACLR